MLPKRGDAMDRFCWASPSPLSPRHSPLQCCDANHSKTPVPALELLRSFPGRVDSTAAVMLKTLVVAGLGAALVPWLQPCWAEVRAGGLRTRVNGTALGSCGAGLCRVQGGTTAGDTLFFRFAQFDARGAIQGVNLDTRGQRHVVMGVSAPTGTFLDRPLRLDQPTNLVLLSPGGLWLGPGARVVQATNLVFSTSSHLRLGSSLVDVLGSSAAQLRQQAAPPAFDLNSFNDNATTLDGLGLQGAGPIVLAGPQLRIDRNLIIDSGSGGLSTAGPRRALLAAGDTLRLNGASIRLEALDLEAGTPSQDGMVQLTSPGRLSLDRTGLQARALVLQGGDLHLGHSTLLAPKGQIRLVASGPGGAAHAITVEGSHLDVGARSRADLAKVVKGTVVVDGASIESNQPIPAIALFAEGDVLISGGSRLQASQDVPGIRARDPGPLTDVQLTPVSGEVVVVAGGRLVVRDSSLRADATDNLAGTVALQSQGPEGRGGLTLERAVLSASGGAGGGDLWLGSRSGIRLQDSSLTAETDRALPDSLNGGMFLLPPGEINLINQSRLQPIQISGSVLQTPYHSGAGFLPLDPLPEALDSDSEDFSVIHPGGRINLFSRGGITVEGRSLLQANGGPPKDATADQPATEPGAGAIRLINEGRQPLTIRGGSRLEASAGSDLAAMPALYEPVLGGGLIQLWSAAGLNLEHSALILRTDHRLGMAPPAQLLVAAQGNLSLNGAELDLGHRFNPDAVPLVTSVVSLLSRADLRVANSALQLGDDIPRLGDDMLPILPSTAIGLISGRRPANTSSFTINTKVGTIDPAGYAVVDPLAPVPEDQTHVFSSDPTALQAKLDQQVDTTRRVGVAPETNVVVPFGAPPLLLQSNLGQPLKVILDPSQAQLAALAGPATARSPALGGSDGLARTAETRPPTALLPEGIVVQALSGEEAGERLLVADQRSAADTLAALGLPPTALGAGTSLTSLQERLRMAMDQVGRPAAGGSSAYRPAIVRFSLWRQASPGEDRLELVYLPANGAPQGWQVRLPEGQLAQLVQAVQRNLSRMESSGLGDDPALQRLSQLLLAPLGPLLERDRVEALWLAADRGLQAIPFAALRYRPGSLGEQLALSVTPSLSLLPPGSAGASASPPGSGRLLLAGSSRFRNGLAPLPMVRQELHQLAREQAADLLLDEDFTPAGLQRLTRRGQYRQVHLATHAEFRPGQSAAGWLHTWERPMALAELGRVLAQGGGPTPLDLVVLSACRTTLGDERSELGLVGLALAAGSRSGLGTLWYVDDTANAAFFVQFYRYLHLGYRKDEALRLTRRAFQHGEVHLQGREVIGVAGTPLITGLSRSDQLRFGSDFRHPYYWSGIVLSGSAI